MAKHLLPKPGTVLSVELEEDGPLIKVEGDTIGILFTFGVIAGYLNKNCDIPTVALTDAVAHGRELLEILSANAMTVDLNELKRQAATMAKEDEHEDT